MRAQLGLRICSFNSLSGPGRVAHWLSIVLCGEKLPIRFAVRAHTDGNQSMFLCLSLPRSKRVLG